MQQERDGVQQWRTVYQWAASLVAEAVAAGRMEDRLGPAANVHAMLLEIRNAGGRIFTMMNSQLPYTCARASSKRVTRCDVRALTGHVLPLFPLFLISFVCLLPSLRGAQWH